MGDTERHERPKRAIKKTAVVTDNEEFDKLLKKVTKTDKKGRAETAADKQKEKVRERELSKERKKAADDLARLAALKKAADREVKKAPKEKKSKDAKDKDNVDKAKVEKEKKDKPAKKDAPKNIPVPKPSPKCKKPIGFQSDTDEENPKKTPVPKPSPLCKKPKGYSDKPQECSTDAGVRERASRKLNFDDESTKDVSNVSVMDESTSKSVTISQDMVAPPSSEEDSSENTEDEKTEHGKFGQVKQTLQKASQEMEETELTSEKSITHSFKSMDEVEDVLNAAKKAKAELLSKEMTQKLNMFDNQLSKVQKLSESHLRLNELQSQVQDLREGMQKTLANELSADDMLSHMSLMVDTTQDIENELIQLKEQLRLKISKRDAEIEDYVNYMTNTTTKYFKTSEAYENQNFDNIERDLKTNFRKYLVEEEQVMTENKDKKAFQEELEPYKKNLMVSLLECLGKIYPELAPIGEAALKHTMKMYNYRKQRLAEENKQRRKVTFSDEVEQETRNKLFDDVINVNEDLEAWKGTFFDKIREKLSNQDAVTIETKYDSYKKILSEIWKTDTTLQDKVTKLSTLNKDISLLHKEAKSYIDKGSGELKNVISESETQGDITAEEIDDHVNYITNSTITFMKTSDAYDNQNLDDFAGNLKESFHKYIAMEQNMKKTNDKKAFEEEMEPYKKNLMVTLLECLGKIYPELAPIGEAALKSLMKYHNKRNEIISKENHTRKKLQVERRKVSNEVATRTCIANAINHLKHEYDLGDETIAFVRQAVEEFFELKLNSKADETLAKDKESPLAKASIHLSNVLREIFGDSCKTIFKDLLQYLDPSRHYARIVKVGELSERNVETQKQEAELKEVREQLAEQCKLFAQWQEEKLAKYRDLPEDMLPAEFEDRYRITTEAIENIKNVIEKSTVNQVEYLKEKLRLFTKAREGIQSNLEKREQRIAPLKKSPKTMTEEGQVVVEETSTVNVKSPTATKSNSSKSTSPSSSSSSPRFVTRTPTPSHDLESPTAELATTHELVGTDIGDIDMAHIGNVNDSLESQVEEPEEIDFAAIPLNTQLNEAIANPISTNDINVDIFDNLTEQEALQALVHDEQRILEEPETKGDDNMLDVDKSPVSNVTPELAATDELVEKDSEETVKSPILEQKKGVADKISIYVGDITKLHVDAIVNAANESLLGGGGIDGAIHKAAGPQLLQECKTLKGCKTGEAKITSGYKLPAKHIIHTVGPRGENKEKLKSSYESSMQLLIDKNLKTIAFPCISTGIFGYPAEKAASVAVKTVKKFVKRNEEKIDRVTFCLYNQTDVEIYKNLMQKKFPGENIEMVSEKEQKNTGEKDKKRDRSPSTASDDEHVKASRKKLAAKKRKTKTEMIHALLNPLKREKKVEDDKPKVPIIIKSDEAKKAKAIKAKMLDTMSDKVTKVRSLLKVKKEDDKSDSKKDLTPDSSDHDKTWKPPKKDPPGSSDDFKEEMPRGKKKVFTKKRSTPKVGKKGKPGKDAKEEGEKDDKIKKAIKRSQPRRPNVKKKDFQAMGFELASPTTVSKETFLTWTEALEVVKNKDMTHTTLNCYFEPKGNEVYKITEVFTRTEDVAEYSHRDNFYTAAIGGAVKYEDKKRYKYKTKTHEGEWSTEHFCKYIFTFPKQSCIVLQYVGDPSQALQKSDVVEPPEKKGKHVSSSEDDVMTATKTAKKGPRLSMLDPSDFEMTDAAEKEDSDNEVANEEELQKEWEKKVEESASRKVEKQNNNLAKFFQIVKEEKKYESSQHVPHIPMINKREAVEAFVLEDEDQAITNKQLDAVINEAVRLGEGIENGNETYISVPEGGKVYLFDCRKTQQPWNKMLLNDGFRYKLKDHLYLPNSNFDKTKYYGYTFNSEGNRMQPTATFKKYTYFNTESGILAIHYRGNVQDVSRVPHGNAKTSTQVFVPTSKGIEKDIDEHYKGISRHKTYHDMTSKLPGGVASTIVGPRNLEAVGYLKQKLDHKSWVDNLDEVKKVSLVADYLGDFVRGSTTKPYFAALLATEAGLTELRRVIDKMPGNTALEGYYDTTFEFGNQYASIYSYRHPFLQRIKKNSASKSDKPIVPVFFMLHQKKFQVSHEFMFRTAQEAFDKKYSHAKKTFANTRKVLVSDKEFDGAKLLSNCKTIHCWNHLKKNISSEAKYKKHVRDKELAKIERDFDNILLTTTEAEYTNLRDKILAKRHWKNTGMADYYMSTIDEDFQNNSARWVLEEWGIGHGALGITNNPAETVNSVIHNTKDDEELKKIHKNYTVPDTLLFFHHYAQCNDKEIRSAYHNATTDFQVRPEYKAKFQKELKLMPPVYIQDVAEMKQELKDRLDPKHEPMEEETPDKVAPPKASEPDAYKKLAEQHIKENRICKVPNLRCYFGVRDMAHENMVWVDYMVDKCSCPIGTKGQCPHKLAVQIKYSLPEPPVRARAYALDKSMAYNPTLKKRPRYGKKKPSTDDTHDIAAHGMKKEKASDVRKMKKTVKDEFDVAEDKMKEAEEEEVEVNLEVDDGLTLLSIKPAKKVVDPALVFQCDSFDMTSFQQDLTPEQATVMPFKAKVFSINSEEKFAIFSPASNTAVLLFHQKEKANLETTHIMKLAALSTRRGATFNIHRHNKPMAAVSYRVVRDNIDLKTAASQLHKRGNWDKAGDVHLELACYCRMPYTIDDDKSNVAKCSNCSSHYHKSCLGDDEKSTVDDSAKKWKCKSCQIPRNIEWGHMGVCTNTCPVDPMFQTVYLSISDDKELINNFPDDNGHQTLKKAMMAIEEGNCFAAQSMWYDLVENTNPGALMDIGDPGNLWGNVSEIAYKPLQAGKQFQRILQCDNYSCPEPYTFQDKTNSLVIRANEGNAKDQIDHLLSERTAKKCMKCKIGKVTGDRVCFSSNNKVWFIEFIGSGFHTEADGIHNDLDFKPVIHIPDETGIEHEFKFKSITYNQDTRKHFVSIHRVDDAYIFADPLMEKTSTDDTDTKKAKKNFPLRYRAPLPSDHDFHGPNKASITSIIYVRQF